MFPVCAQPWESRMVFPTPCSVTNRLTTFSTLYEIWQQQNGDSLLQKTTSSTNCKRPHFQTAKENFRPSFLTSILGFHVYNSLLQQTQPKCFDGTAGYFLGSRERSGFWRRFCTHDYCRTSVLSAGSGAGCPSRIVEVSIR